MDGAKAAAKPVPPKGERKASGARRASQQLGGGVKLPANEPVPAPAAAPAKESMRLMSTKEKRRYLLDVDAVEVLDSMVVELLKRRPPKSMVVPMLVDILQAMDDGNAAPAHEAVSLIDAAGAGDAAQVRELLAAGCDPNASDENRFSALHSACENGQQECAEVLLAAGANVNARDKFGAQPLDAAKSNGHAGVEKMIRARGGGHGRVKSRTGSQDTQQLVRCVMLSGAAGRGDAAEVQRLLQTGIPATVEDYDYRTPLHLAAEGGHLEVVKVLVAAGASGTAKDKWGNTPLSGAEQGGHGAVVEFLAEQSAVQSMASSMLRSPKQPMSSRDCLFMACQRGDLARAAELISSGVSVNEADYDMRRPLHLAAEEGHCDVVELLVEKGADLNVADRWGTTPLQGALHNCHNDVVSHLKDYGADVALVSLSAPVFNHSTRAMRYFESTLHLAGLPKARLMPCGALVQRLSTEYGLDLRTHKVLVKELKTLLSASPGELTPEVKEAFATYNAGLSSAFPREQIDTDMFIELETFVDGLTGKLPGPNPHTLQHVVFEKTAVPGWIHFVKGVGVIFEEVLQTENDGANAQYIPELKNADSSPFAVSLCTVQGQECHFGEHTKCFSAQSTAKTFAYTMAVHQHGGDYVHKYVGQEPSGRAFNAFELTRDGRPFNPVTNGGSIVTCTMVSPEKPIEERVVELREWVQTASGGMEVGECTDVYRSEQGCAFRNYALANFMKAENTFPDHVTSHKALADSVNFYLRVCSIKVNTQVLARCAATYANSGTNPLTGEQVATESEVKQTLQILYSCGMYDFSGEWACTIGMPAKSGVSGNIMIVVPGVLGMCVWSPKLDPIGNSVRGIRFAKKFAEKFRMSLLDTLLRGRCEL